MMQLFIQAISIINPIIGVGCLLAAVLKHRARLAHLKRSELIDGKVINLEEDSCDVTKWPFFSVTLPDGTVEIFKGNVASNPPRFTVGQDVKVFFCAKGIPRFIVADRWELWFVAGMLYAVGIAGMISPIFLYLMKPYLIH
jgi:hypothetical protein